MNLQINDRQIGDFELEEKIEHIKHLVKIGKNIGLELIDLLGDDRVISQIHEMAEEELSRGLMSYYGSLKCDRELIFISLTIIAILHYEEGRYYESVRDTYISLYDKYSAQKIEGFIRSILSGYRTEQNERQVNVVLRNAVVPGFYLAAFFDFIFDIYKLNFQYNLPEDLYDEFLFVYEGLRQNMLSDGDDVLVEVTNTKKTYKLIKTTKQLIADEKMVEAVIKLSIIAIELIDKKIWDKEIKINNPYVNYGFEGWAKKVTPSSHDLKDRKISEFRSRWEPKFVLLDNTVYIEPPAHRVKSVYDYSSIRIEVTNQGENLYLNDRPDVREIMGGYEINLEKIRISCPLGKVTYRLCAGDDVIYDSKDNLYRSVIAFSYDDNSEIKNNTDFGGTIIFCYSGESNNLTPYHRDNRFNLAEYGAHQGESVLIGDYIFNFSSLIRPGIFGEEIVDQYLYDPEKNRKISVFKDAKYLVFETKNKNAAIEVNIDGKANKVTELDCEISDREGGISKYIIHIPALENGIHNTMVYEMMDGRKTELASFEFAIDTVFQAGVKSDENNSYEVEVESGILKYPVSMIISSTSFSPDWLRFELHGREYCYLAPMPFNFYSLDGKIWKTNSDYLWIGDISPDTTIRVSNRRITEMKVYGENGRTIVDSISLSHNALFAEAKLGFLKSYASSNSHFLLVMMEKTSRVDVLICYCKCTVSTKTLIEYNKVNKDMEVRTEYYGKGNVYFIIEDGTGQALYKSEIVHNGQLVATSGVSFKSFVPYYFQYYEKKMGLSLGGDKKLERFEKIVFDLDDLPGKYYKVIEAYYDTYSNGKLVRQMDSFRNTVLHILNRISEDTFEGEIYVITSKANFYLNRVNPVRVEIISDVSGNRLEVSITKDDDGLLLDKFYHAPMNTLENKNAMDIFYYVIDLRGYDSI